MRVVGKVVFWVGVRMEWDEKQEIGVGIWCVEEIGGVVGMEEIEGIERVEELLDKNWALENLWRGSLMGESWKVDLMVGNWMAENLMVEIDLNLMVVSLEFVGLVYGGFEVWLYWECVRGMMLIEGYGVYSDQESIG